MSLEAKIRETVRKYQMVSYGDEILVGVSGGPDSVALLHLLCALRGELGLRLSVAHLAHGIRGDEARRDARFVARMAARLSVPFHLKEVDLPGLKSEKGRGNIEAMARDERYRFFRELARHCRIKTIATGHTRDDLVETFLMWLLRGSGRKGLGGFAPARRLDESSEAPLLIRPLIETSREEILHYLGGRGLDYRLDRTNLDPTPLRNWIRLRLLPLLTQRTDARLQERLARLAEVLREEEDILAELSAQRFQRVFQSHQLGRRSFLGEGKAMQRRLIRLFLQSGLGSLRGIGFGQVEDIVQFIAKGPPQGRLSLPGNWDLVKDYDTVRLDRKKRGREPAICYQYTLPCEGELVIAEARLRMVSSRNRASEFRYPRSDLEAVFDRAFIPETLTVRNFRAGDRFQPLGMQGHKKLKDLFIEKKVPIHIRRTLPLLVSRDEVLWIPQYGRSGVASVGPGTKEVLWVRIECLNEETIP